MSDKPEIVVGHFDTIEERVTDGNHTFVLGMDESLPICGYTSFEYDQICINKPRHAGQPHFVITGQAHDRFPALRVLEVICHD